MSTLTFLDPKLRTAFRDCLQKVLLLASKFEDSIRARDAIRHPAHMLATLISSHCKKVAMTRAKAFMKGAWKSLWNKCRSQGVAHQKNWRRLRKRQLRGAPSRWMFQHKNTLGPAIYPRPAKYLLQHSKQTLWTNSRPKTHRTPLTLILVTSRRQRRWMLCIVMTTGRILKPNLFLSRRLINISPAARH